MLYLHANTGLWLQKYLNALFIYLSRWCKEKLIIDIKLFIQNPNLQTKELKITFQFWITKIEMNPNRPTNKPRLYFPVTFVNTKICKHNSKENKIIQTKQTKLYRLLKKIHC